MAEMLCVNLVMCHAIKIFLLVWTFACYTDILFLLQIVTHIMRFLSVSDRKEASQVCRIWYEASLDPILQKDIIIRFHALTANNMPQLPHRKTSHLIMDQFDTSNSAKSVMLNSCKNFGESLQSLSLKASNLTESTFVELLTHCKNLKSLDLSCCNSLFMSGKLLERNSDMQALRKTLKDVKKLNLSSVRYLSDATFNRIVTVCENLESLSLSSSQITFNGEVYLKTGSTKCASSSLLTYGNILEYVRIQAPKLKSLNLSRNSLSNESLQDLVRIKDLNLNELILVGCKDIYDEGIADLCQHQKSLRLLDLSGCIEVSDGCVGLISSNLGNLETLKINKCRRVTDSSIQLLKHMSSLQVLELSEIYQISSTGLIKGICGNVNVSVLLTHLNINCCSLVQDSFILSLCKVVPHLVHLDLGSCFPLTDVSIHAISRSLKCLRYLRLAWCKEITDLGLLGFEATETGNKEIHNHGDNGNCRCTRKYNSTTIFRKPTGIKNKTPSTTDIEALMQNVDNFNKLTNLSGLRHLDLSSCSKLTDLSLTQILKFKELQSLNLSMVHIKDATVFAIAANNPSLEFLAFAQCSAITDAAVEAIAKKIPRLSSLDVSSCDLLTEESIQHLQKHCKRLRCLDVSFCSNISAESVDNLENNVKTLHTVHKRLVGGTF
ncbi:hypothetical protein KUTeg_018914 [Tegillarca granosa]|uniref:F-box/LRR-repeat protein 15-like leucin rich repeat domain-containing protein n=1 Tax=Tegillarca granosa TaxID=220873 RepID=A0ABQ9EGY6_TEGGR|nr:hypothetical protein KUTeg_018914 [Tegillarca granosa]